ncbi:MAG: YbaK/EbsC family protein [Bacillota bacterium]
MHRNAERVQEALRSRGAKGQVIEFEATTRTSADAAAAIGATVAQIAKSLVFMAGEELVLVIASGTNRVSMAKLAALLGAPVRRPDGDTVKQRTGFPIGGVPPVGHDTPLRTLIDQDLSGSARSGGRRARRMPSSPPPRRSWRRSRLARWPISARRARQ